MPSSDSTRQLLTPFYKKMHKIGYGLWRRRLLPPPPPPPHHRLGFSVSLTGFNPCWKSVKNMFFFPKAFIIISTVYQKTNTPRRKKLKKVEFFLKKNLGYFPPPRPLLSFRHSRSLSLKLRWKEKEK